MGQRTHLRPACTAADQRAPCMTWELEPRRVLLLAMEHTVASIQHKEIHKRQLLFLYPAVAITDEYTSYKSIKCLCQPTKHAAAAHEVRLLPPARLTDYALLQQFKMRDKPLATRAPEPPDFYCTFHILEPSLCHREYLHTDRTPSVCKQESRRNAKTKLPILAVITNLQG